MLVARSSTSLPVFQVVGRRGGGWEDRTETGGADARKNPEIGYVNWLWKCPTELTILAPSIPLVL